MVEGEEEGRGTNERNPTASRTVGNARGSPDIKGPLAGPNQSELGLAQPACEERTDPPPTPAKLGSHLGTHILRLMQQVYIMLPIVSNTTTWIYGQRNNIEQGETGLMGGSEKALGESVYGSKSIPLPP